MPEVDSSKVRSFPSANELRDWLALNHSTESELWVKIYKKKTGLQSVTWNDLVIESLCWGWIDGVKKSLDDQAYLQRITPRTSKSQWSKRNTEHVARLIKEGRMTEFGLAQVRAAKADGRWDNAYVASAIEVPEDFIAALTQQPKAKQFFENLNKSSRYVIAFGLVSAKKAETRERRFKKYMEMLLREEPPR